VFTVFNSTSAEIQILMTFFICLPFTLLFLKLHPYQDLRLHVSSLLSLLALSFMCYVGFFFLSSKVFFEVTSFLRFVELCSNDSDLHFAGSCQLCSLYISSFLDHKRSNQGCNNEDSTCSGSKTQAYDR